MKAIHAPSIRKMATAVLLGFFLLFPVSLKSQNEVSVSIQIIPPYPVKLNEYADNPQKTIITIRSLTNRALDIQLRGSIIGENGIEITTSEQFKSPQSIHLNSQETKILNSLAIRDLFDINKLTVNGVTRDELARGNGLPEGSYRICARAYDYQTNEPLSADDPLGCSNLFRITNLEPPTIIKPFFEEVVNTNGPQNVIFTWSFPAGAPPATQFKLKVVEILNPERNINDAVLSASTPPFLEQTVMGNAFIFGPAQPSLIKGRKYAFTVTAVDPFGKAVFKNNGQSEVSAFTYGTIPVAAVNNDFENIKSKAKVSPPPIVIGPMKAMNAAGPNVCKCLEEIPAGAVDNSKAIVGSKVKIGKFEMTVLEAREEAGVLKGRGKINFPILNSKLIPLLVEFADLKINGSNQAISGTVKAKVKSDVDFIPSAPAPNVQALPLSSSDAQKLDEYFKANVDKLVSNISSSIDNIGFEMPLGIDKNIGGINTVIAITGATFTPAQATFEAAMVINIPDGATKIALAAKNVCMDNTGLCGQGILYLAEDFNIAPLSIKLKGAAASLNNPQDSGTYVMFDKDGFQRMRIQAEYAFPTSLIVKKSDKASQVKATLTTSAISWSNWMADVSIDPFYISGNTDFGFSLVGSGVYDHSTTTNHAGMPVIKDKTNINTPDWTGFYLAALNVELPALIKNANSPNAISVSVNKLIIDNQGVTGSITANNVLAIGNGDLGGWYYSVDNIGVNFLNNSFVSGGMAGKVVLPISGSTPGNPKGQLDYTSTLSRPAGNLEFQFVIKPKNDLDIPFWYATFSLAQTSNITVKAGGGKFNAAAVLNGAMDIVADIGPLPKINFRAMEFEELKIQTEAPYLGIKNFRAGFASPNKSLSGFPVGLTDIKPIINGTIAGMGFTLKLSLCDIAAIPEAEFSFELLGKIGFAGGRPSWSYDKLNLSKIKVKGSLGPVTVDGEVKFFNNDPVFGNGVSGSLEANMISGFSTKANVLFGHTDFYYWYVDALLKLPPPGIPLGAPMPLSIFGFGGGAYYHLAQKPLQNPQEYYSNPDITSKYVPNRNTVGFNATVIMGTSDGSTFQALGTLSAILNERTMAPVQLGIDIDAAMLSPLMNTKGAFIKGHGYVKFDFAQNIFAAGVDVNVDLAGLISGKGSIRLFIDGNNKLWYFKVGEPSDRVTLSVLDFLKFDSYFMMGNTGIEGVPAPPPQVLEQIHNYTGNRSSTASGAGLAFGASMGFGPKDLEFLIFYMRLGAGLGYDISLQKLTEGCDNRGGLPGIDGWYASGQMYMWAEFAFGLHVDVWFYEGKISVAELKAAALLRAGLPNPAWFDGWLHGEYSVLDGLISGTMNFHVKVGDKCIPKSDPFGGIPLISELSPANENVSILADPQATFNFPVGTNFTIATTNENGNTVNREFIIELQQFDVIREKTGTIHCSPSKCRKFKMSDFDKLATIYTEESFETQEKYKIRVKVKAFEIIGSQKIACTRKGKDVEEYKELDFKSGECIVKLNAEDVLVTYPIANQRYFLQQESPVGFVEIRKNIGCLLSDYNYSLMAIITVMKSKTDYTTIEQPITPNQYQLTFPMPKLPNEQIIEVKIVKRRKQKALLLSNSKQLVSTSNFSYATKNKYLGQYQFAEVKLGSISGVSESVKQVPDIELYKFYFKTSKFNTLKEKLSDMQSSAVAKKTAIGILEIYEGEYGLKEGFDIFDIKGYKSLMLEYRTSPIVLVSESQPRNKWSEGYIRNDFYSNWAKGYYGGYIDDLSPRYIRQFSVPIDEIVAFAPPSMPVDFYLSTIDPPLSSGEINALKNTFINTASSVLVKSIVPKISK